MRANGITPSVAALAVALASSGASAQSVVTRSVTVEPVETTVTQTPNGTIVTRRPVEGQVAQRPILRRPIVQTGPAIVEGDPGSIDSVTTREVVERAAATEAMRPRRMTTRQVSSTRQTNTRSSARRARAARDVVRRTTTTTRTAPRLALNPRERHIVYQTIVERDVMPARQVVVAPPPIVSQPPLIQREVALRPPIVAADEDEIVRPMAPVYAVGATLPRNVPLYAMPRNVALSVPAARTYSYAYLGGRAYLVDPATNTVVEDVTE